MEHIDVVSTNITYIEYDNGTLKVGFTSRKSYEYKNVPQETFEAFKNSESKGKYFAKHIKNKFE